MKHIAGFCYFNNVAIGAKHAIATGRASRVFIFDLDIHHGNGTQDIVADDPNIFYLSIHRASFKSEKNWFYPGTGSKDDVGEGDGVGTNLNIVWEQSGMGNTEYAIAMTQLVLPALRLFKPDLILVSAGLDAAEGDLLGDCSLTPDAYYAITNALLNEAGRKTPLVVVLEGGYNLNLSADCMEAMSLAMLDEPWKEDKSQYEEMEHWSSRSLLPLKKSMVLHQSNPYNLERYLDVKKITEEEGGRIPKTVRHALASVGRSARAFEKSMHQASMKKRSPCCHYWGLDDVHVPLKKRQVHNRFTSRTGIGDSTDYRSVTP